MRGMETELQELRINLQESNAKREKIGDELKYSINKVFGLREIIAELELKVETKTISENLMREQIRVSTTRRERETQNTKRSLSTPAPSFLNMFDELINQVGILTIADLATKPNKPCRNSNKHCTRH